MIAIMSCEGEPVRQAILVSAPTRRFAKGTAIFHRGDTVHATHLVRAGTVTLERSLRIETS